MGYAKKAWAEQQELEQLSHRISERRAMLPKVGWQTSEEDYVKSLERFLALAKQEDNLAILSELSKALFNMVEIADRTWNWRMLEPSENEEAKKLFLLGGR